MTYGCQQYTITRLCRYDRRAIDIKCDGCQRTTDSEYLMSAGLLVIGVSHPIPVFDNDSIKRKSK